MKHQLQISMLMLSLLSVGIMEASALKRVARPAFQTISRGYKNLHECNPNLPQVSVNLPACGHFIGLRRSASPFELYALSYITKQKLIDADYNPKEIDAKLAVVNQAKRVVGIYDFDLKDPKFMSRLDQNSIYYNVDTGIYHTATGEVLA